jgi:hypothetical protein
LSHHFISDPDPNNVFRRAQLVFVNLFRSLGIDSQPGGPVHRLAESIPRLLKRLQIRAQVPYCGDDCDPQHGYCTVPGECRSVLVRGGQGRVKKIHETMCSAAIGRTGTKIQELKGTV